MIEIGPDNVAGYLGYSCTTRALGGGVSNTVLLVEAPGRRFVLKQSLGKLRVEQDWYSDRRRIFRECAAMRCLWDVLPPGAVPEVLFEDRKNFLFAMTAAPHGAEPWKDQLLRGEVHYETAETIAAMLGRMIAATWRAPPAAEEFGDQTVFDELRLDPYYRSTALRHPDLADILLALIKRSGERRFSLVHGDWSPKNFLVSGAAVMAIDFEVIHFGDPSFDAAFLLNHLLLKSFYRWQSRAPLRDAALRFWSVLTGYVPPPADWFEPAVLEHLGALLLARIDGKSPAEYIQDRALKARIRQFARQLVLSPPQTVPAVFDRMAALP